MTQLHGFIEEYGEGRIRADLAHLHGIDLDDVLYGPVSVRQAVKLLEQSSEYPDSLIRSEIVGREAARWDVTTSAVAHLADLMADLLAGLSKTPAEKLRFPRPAVKAKVEAKEPQLFAPSIAAFNVGKFMQKFG